MALLNGTSFGLLDLAADGLALVFEHLSAYDLASLVHSGSTKLRQRIVQHATRFTLCFDPQRRLAWPGKFIQSLTALRYVTISGFTPKTYPFVPDIDLSVLPPQLVSLELRISNGLLAVLTLPATGSSSKPSFPLRDFRSHFPKLQRLEWQSLLQDRGDKYAVHNFFEHLPWSLRSLSVTLLAFRLADFELFPTTIEELSISARVWTKPSQETLIQVPHQIRKLALIDIRTDLGSLAWPSSLDSLYLTYTAWTSFIQTVSMSLGPTRFPKSLKSFTLLAPKLLLDKAFMESLPSNAHVLRIYVHELVWREFAELEVGSMIPSDELRILHLNFTRTPSREAGLLISSFLFQNMPPKLVEFAVTGLPVPVEMLDNLPQNLVSLRLNPALKTGVHPSINTLQESLAETGEILALYPKGLLDLESSILHLRHFPPTLTRLSISTPTASPLDPTLYQNIAEIIPNVKDLSILMDGAFDVARRCATLPLESLLLDAYPGRLSDDLRKEATEFDLRCFPRLKSLTIHPRFIEAHSRVEWLQRLPEGLLELCLTPPRVMWTMDDLPFGDAKFESWLTFQHLPRGLTRLAGIFSDMDITDVFRLLPDSLTELIIPGSFTVQGCFQASLKFPAAWASQVRVKTFDSLPLALTTLVLPHGCMPDLPPPTFYASRPQLANFMIYSNNTGSDSPSAMPPGLRLPPSLEMLSTILRHVEGSRCDTLSSAFPLHQALAPPSDDQFHCADRAVRPPLSLRTQKEIAVMQKGLAMQRKGDDVGRIWSVTRPKLDAIAANPPSEEEKPKKASRCNPS